MKRASPVLLGLFLLVFSSLAGCTLPGAPAPSPTINFTQVYQTVEAMLTQTLPAAPPQTSQPAPTSSQQVDPSSTEIPTQSVSTTPSTLPGNPTVTALCDIAAAGSPIDVTIPDDTVMQPGEAFTKIWKLVNAGSCAWTKDYTAVFFYGELMGALEAVPLGEYVQPGQTVEIAVEMVAPSQPGSYQSNWKLRNPGGVFFGIGPNGDAPYWVRIQVVEPTAGTLTPTVQPSHTSAPTDTPAPTETSTAPPPVQVSATISLLIEDVLDLDTGEVNPGDGHDLAYRMEGDNYHWLFPKEEAQLGVYGTLQPDLLACQSASMSAAPIAVESLSVGTYLCYRTGQGAPGWLLFSGIGENCLLSLQLLTWVAP